MRGFLPWWLAVVLVLAGCSATSPSPTQVATGTPMPIRLPRLSPTLSPALQLPATALPPVTITPSPTSVPTEPPATLVLLPTATRPDESSPFAGSLEALEHLDSYRYRIVFEVKAEGVGEASAGLMVLHLEGESVAPDREHVRWLLPGEGLFLEVIRVGQRIWVNEGGTWSELPAGQREDLVAGLLSPVRVWASFVEDLPGTSVLAGDELVSGLRARHFRSTSRAWGALALPPGGQITEATGDVWIAADGPFPIRARFTALGVDSTGRIVSVDFTFELMDINEPMVIEVP